MDIETLSDRNTITPITAHVVGSLLYSLTIAIDRWRALK
jgi:hypothetical protein